MTRAARVVGARGGGRRREEAAGRLALATLPGQRTQLPLPLNVKEGSLRRVALLPRRQAAYGHLQVVTPRCARLANHTLWGRANRYRERERSECVAQLDNGQNL